MKNNPVRVNVGQGERKTRALKTFPNRRTVEECCQAQRYELSFFEGDAHYFCSKATRGAISGRSQGLTFKGGTEREW